MPFIFWIFHIFRFPQKQLQLNKLCFYFEHFSWKKNSIKDNSGKLGGQLPCKVTIHWNLGFYLFCAVKDSYVKINLKKAYFTLGLK